MKKILITGATGNLGGVLKSDLIKNNYDVLCLTKRKIKSKREIYGDLNDYYSLLNATKDINIVIHLAGVINGSKKLLNKVNIQGTKNLINVCERNKVKKIIFISSLDVKLETPYGISKLKAEEIIKNSKLKYIILRPCVIYGKGFKKGINLLVKILKKMFIIPIIGSGKNLYQPLYVEDLVLLIKQIIDKNKFNNKTYFLGGKTTINMNQLIDLICLNLKKKVIKIPLPINLKKFLFDKTCDNTKIKKDFDFNPISIEEGIEKIL